MIGMELEEIRKEIDKIDNEILAMLAKRKALAKEIALIKKSRKMPILDEKREAELIKRLKKKAKELIENYFYEKEKRGIFTYDMGMIALENKAKTSLERAKRFSEEIRKMLMK